jgi:aminoglycoside phosphotransferase (APT) family kinase protein
MVAHSQSVLRGFIEGVGGFAQARPDRHEEVAGRPDQLRSRGVRLIRLHGRQQRFRFDAQDVAGSGAHLRGGAAYVARRVDGDDSSRRFKAPACPYCVAPARCYDHTAPVILNLCRDGRAGVDAGLVKRLIAAQFPQWGDLAVHPVEFDGWDNRTYRLGENLSVRLPTARGYAAAVDKEHYWLPVLAPKLPVAIPIPVAKGTPDQGYPFNWSVRQWLDGQPAHAACIPDLSGVATAVAAFIAALQRIDTTGAPPAGPNSAFRGGPLIHYDSEVRDAVAALTGRIDTMSAAAVWRAAVETSRHGRFTWFHGDVAAGNLLIKDGKLAAVIDFGTCGVGDPACDLVIAWTLFRDASRATFKSAVAQDSATWTRARGWALWKALIGLARDIDVDEPAAMITRGVIDAVLTDHQQAG